MSRLSLSAPDLAKIAVFAAVICALAVPGAVHLFGSAVPITLQTLGVMLAGSLLGAWRGFLAVVTYLAVGAIGLPVFAGGAAGLGVFGGPTAGYLIGFPFGALAIGLIVSVLHRYLTPAPAKASASEFVGSYKSAWTTIQTHVAWFVANVIGGIGVIYAIGVPVLAWRADLSMSDALYTGATIFLPLDLFKAGIATIVAIGVYRAYPPIAGYRELREVGSASS
jgi:biotin transport system substrate-specific component